MIVPIVIFILLVAAAIVAFSYRNRSEKGIESGISSFRRELDALAPRHQHPQNRGARGGVEPTPTRPESTSQARGDADDRTSDQSDVSPADAPDADEASPVGDDAPDGSTPDGSGHPGEDDERGP